MHLSPWLGRPMLRKKLRHAAIAIRARHVQWSEFDQQSPLASITPEVPARVSMQAEGSSIRRIFLA